MSETPEFPRPTPNAVVGRTLVLTVLHLRLIQEAVVREGNDAQKADARAKAEVLGQLGATFQTKNLFSKNEWRLFSSPLGSWSDRDGINVDWRKECIGVFGWALGKEQAILPFDQGFDLNSKDYMDSMMALMKSNSATLRPDDEISNAQEMAKIWHWRARTTRIIKEGRTPPAGYTFERIIEISAKGSFDLGWIPKPIAGDFPFLGKPYRDLTEDEYHFATSVAMERHYALNWLCGYSNDWDCVSTGT